MHKIELSQILKKDLMAEKSQYVGQGYITFTHIQIKIQEDMLIINFFYGDDLLATMKQKSWPMPDSIDFKLTEGLMRMDLADG